ncbi:MAG: RodZ domain-containing protein [Pseudomonadota bacterium]
MIGWRLKPSQAEVEKPKGFDDFELRLGDLMRGERATLGKSLLDVQRELKIKATYIAAIENADVSAFETPGFVAGYVRSYARYLGMDPEDSFQRFCAEANFAVAHGMSAAASTKLISASRNRADYDDPLANPNATFVPRGESVMAQVEPGAIGSILVLVALIAALGYGGWSLLREVQRVQLAPIDEAPTVVAEIDPLGNVAADPALVRSAPKPDEASRAAAAEAGVTADPLDRLYRPKALDVPVLTARDGPIAAINPRETGALAVAQGTDAVAQGTDAAIEAALGEALVGTADAIQVVADVKPGVEVLAVRPSWVRVSSADGTVLFEKILDAGERYSVPPLEEGALFRTGNSGSIYFVVNGATFGPAAPGANVVSNISLLPDSLMASYAAADPSADVDLAKFATAQAGPAAALPDTVAD